jgi:hypothetical protein
VCVRGVGGGGGGGEEKCTRTRVDANRGQVGKWKAKDSGGSAQRAAGTQVANRTWYVTALVLPMRPMEDRLTPMAMMHDRNTRKHSMAVKGWAWMGSAVN